MPRLSIMSLNHIHASCFEAVRVSPFLLVVLRNVARVQPTYCMSLSLSRCRRDDVLICDNTRSTYFGRTDLVALT